MGLSQSTGYVEEDLEVVVVASGPNAERALQRATVQVLEDGYGLDEDEQRQLDSSFKKRQTRQGHAQRSSFHDPDPSLFGLLETLGLEPVPESTAAQVVLQMLPLCGPQYAHFPRLDHFVMRILHAEEDKAPFRGALSEEGDTLLGLACRQRSVELFGFAVEKVGVDAQQCNKSGVSPLHQCVRPLGPGAGAAEGKLRDASFELAERLLRLGVAVDAADEDGKTALHWSAATGAATTVALLLLYGANPRHEDLDGKRPIEYALEGSHVQCVSLLHMDTNWEEFHDRKSGRPFFINRVTNEQSMERPLAVPPGLLSVVHQAQQQQSSAQLLTATTSAASLAADSQDDATQGQQGGDPGGQDSAVASQDSHGDKDAAQARPALAAAAEAFGAAGKPSSASESGSGARRPSLLRRGSSSLRNLARRDSFREVRERMRLWRELAWREGIRRATRRRKIRTLRAVREYQDKVRSEAVVGRKQIQRMKTELEGLVKSREITDAQLAALEASLRREQEEKQRIQAQLEKATEKLATAETTLEEAEAERQRAMQEAALAAATAEQLEAMERELQSKAEENAQLRENFLAEQRLRRKTHNLNIELLGAIRVYCRIRPLSQAEAAEHERQGVPGPAVMPGRGAQSDSALVPSKSKAFPLDACLGPEVTQEEVFAQVEPLVMSTIDGYNVCIFAYGQTGSGKSHTMFGPADPARPELDGIAPRSIQTLFSLLQERSSSFSVSCFGVELYNNQLRDLLVKPGGPGGARLAVKRDAAGVVQVENVTISAVESPEALLALLVTMQKQRTVAATKMNAESSRSHLLFVVMVESQSRAGETLRGKLTLVDLAGSEKVSQSGVTGQGLKEATAINQSLSALGDVISALTEKAKFVPYRNHILTQLMADVLGGNAKTLMFVNASPAISSAAESVNSLQYASRVKKVKNSVTRQRVPGPG